VPYDPDRAVALLREAGVPDGFGWTFYVAPDHIVINPEAGAAIAQMWRQIGLNPTIESTAYGAARPRHFEGQDDIMWYQCTTRGDLDQSKGGIYGPSNTFFGAEMPCDIQQYYWDNMTEPDKEKRLANNIAMQDFISNWTLSVPFVTAFDHFMVGPRVKAWTPHEIPGRYFTNPETVEMKD
jgi:peptide/nickel transport system substrate-binding protein